MGEFTNEELEKLPAELLAELLPTRTREKAKKLLNKYDERIKSLKYIDKRIRFYQKALNEAYKERDKLIDSFITPS